MSTAVPPAGRDGSGDPADSAGHDSRSLGEIVGDISSNLTTLLRQELDLAKTELKNEVGRAGKGAGMLAGAGVAAHLLLVFLSLTATFALDTAMPLWLAALIVTLVWAIVAAVLGVMGRKAIKQSQPQLPETQQSLKEDVAWAKAQKS